MTTATATATPLPLVLLDAHRRRSLMERLPAPADRRSLRTAAGLSLRAVATHLGVSEGIVSMWERGVRTPSGTRLGAYVELLEGLDAITSTGASGPTAA